MSDRVAVVAEARRWIGTPYHPAGDILGIGVDCGMLIVRVYVDTGFCAPFEPRPYPPDWHLHRDEERYLGFVKDRCRERGAEEAAQPGDVIVFKFGRCWAHGGIVTGTDPLTLVHAFSESRCVIEEPVDHNVHLVDRLPARLFTPWD